MGTINEKEKKFRFIKPVDNVPFRARRRPGIYDEIIDEFIKSGLEFAEVNDCGRKPVTMASQLRNHLKKRQKNDVRVTFRSKEQKVFLIRRNSS